MDSLDFTKAPSSFQSVKWISDALLLTMAGGWLTSYIATIRTAHGDNACWVPLLPVSCNLAWELVYATIYPPPRLPIVTAWFALNLVVVYTALKYAPDGDARGYSPLRGCRLYLAFVAATALWAAGHVALARVLGPLTAFYYGGLACQLMTSAAALCGLLDSGSSRGASWLIWYLIPGCLYPSLVSILTESRSSRVIGTGSALAGVFFRAYYWPEVWAWTMNPLFYWAAAAFAVFDGAYGVCFWLVRRAEGRAGVKKE